MDEVVDMARGVPQSFYVDEFAGEGIMFEGVAGPPSYAAMSLPLTGRRHADAMARVPQPRAVRPDGERQPRAAACARSPGAPVIRYDLVEADVARFRTGLARMRELLRGGRRARGLPAAAARRASPSRPARATSS